MLPVKVKEVRPKGALANHWRGGRSMTSNGYPLIYMPEHPRANKQYVFEHILVAEKALGHFLPEGAEVHHARGKGSEADNRGENLVICPNRSYHQLLHVRMKIKQRGGDPNLDKICGACGGLKRKTEFTKCRNGRDGLYSECKTCTRARATIYRTKKREAKVAPAK